MLSMGQKRKQQYIIIAILILGFLMKFSIRYCFAITLLTEREALDSVFSGATEVIPETKTINDSRLDKIKSRLGGRLTSQPKGEKAREIMNQREFVFYSGVKDGVKLGVALILTEPGKWGPIDFLVRLDLTGKVQDVVVLKYTEIRGRPMARRSFLAQFIGKTSKDALTLGENVTAISGATISSEAAVFAVKKAIILYEELFLAK